MSPKINFNFCTVIFVLRLGASSRIDESNARHLHAADELLSQAIQGNEPFTAPVWDLGGDVWLHVKEKPIFACRVMKDN